MTTNSSGCFFFPSALVIHCCVMNYPQNLTEKCIISHSFWRSENSGLAGWSGSGSLKKSQAVHRGHGHLRLDWGQRWLGLPWLLGVVHGMLEKASVSWAACMSSQHGSQGPPGQVAGERARRTVPSVTSSPNSSPLL